MSKKKYFPKSSPKKAAKTIKAERSGFPAIGSTLSPYAEAYYGRSVLETPKKWRERISWKRVGKWTAAILAAIIIISASWVGWKFYKNFGGWQGIWGLFHSSKLKGEDTGRVNILLAGNSADDPGHDGANLTDSIMLISIDTNNNTAYMLSIPRDLYVNIPGNGYQKINAAYEDGQAEHFHEAGYPDGGMGLLEEVVSQKLGVPIDYYALIDYSAFRDSVNAVGGITVTINSPDGQLNDPSTDWATHGPLVNHLYNGVHTLNGEQALDLARARGDAYGSIGFERSDFQRTDDQRMMLLALENKALSAGVLSNPIKLGNLFDSIGKNVKTDLTLSNIHRAYSIMKKVGTNNIKSESLSYGGTNPLLVSYDSYASGSALIPAAGIDNYAQIQAFVAKLNTQ